MGINRFDHAHHHILKTLADIFNILHLNGIHCQVISQLLKIRIIGKTYIIFYP